MRAPLVEVTLRYADGTARQLTGDAAERWYHWVDGACVIAALHGCGSTELVPWVYLPSPPKPAGPLPPPDPCKAHDEPWSDGTPPKVTQPMERDIATGRVRPWKDFT